MDTYMYPKERIIRVLCRILEGEEKSGYSILIKICVVSLYIVELKKPKLKIGKDS